MYPSFKITKITDLPGSKISNFTKITDLPEDSIQHIFSLLPTQDAIATSFICKRFRSTWRSLPSISLSLFSYRKYMSRRLTNVEVIDQFLDWATRFIQNRGKDAKVDSFTLIIQLRKSYQYHPAATLIDYGLQHCVSHLEIHCLDHCSPQPPALVLDRAARSLPTLNLEGLHLPNHDDGNSSLCFPPLLESLILRRISYYSPTGLKISILSRLRSLVLDSCIFGPWSSEVEIPAPKLECFTCVNISCGVELMACKSLREVTLERIALRKWVNQQISLLSALEILRLTGSHGEIDINSASLKTLELLSPIEHGLHVGGIDVPKLESIEVSGTVYVCLDQLGACPNLKSLKLHDIEIPHRWLTGSLAKFAQLCHLELSSCQGLTNIKICNQNLKTLHLINNGWSLGAMIDTPQLVTFNFDGPPLLLCQLNCSASLHAVLKLSDFYCDILIHSSEDMGSEYRERLSKFIASFEPCKELTICGRLNEVMVHHKLRMSRARN